MARTTRSETARRSRTSARTNRGMYVDGNTVRRLAEVPERKRQPGRQNPGRQQTNRNRRVQASPAQVGEIVNVSADESVLGENGKIDPAKLDPIVFDPVNMAYLKLGEKVGNAFKDGLALK